MGSPLSPVMANIYMEYFEKLALGTAPLKPSMWLRYVDDTFVLWPHPEDPQSLLDHVNSIRTPIQFTMEKESDNKLAFLDVLVTRSEQAFNTSVYRKPTFTGQYLNFASNHPYSVKKGIVRCLQHRAKLISSDTDTYLREMRTINENLQSNGYPKNIIETTRERRVTEEDDDNNKPTTVCLPYVKNVSEKIQKICIPYNIRVVFQSRSTLRSYISHTKPSTEITNIKNCEYSIHCTCGFFYLGETCRPLKVRVEER